MWVPEIATGPLLAGLLTLLRNRPYLKLVIGFSALLFCSCCRPHQWNQSKLGQSSECHWAHSLQNSLDNNLGANSRCPVPHFQAEAPITVEASSLGEATGMKKLS